MSLSNSLAGGRAGEPLAQSASPYLIRKRLAFSCPVFRGALFALLFELLAGAFAGACISISRHLLHQ
jgi:hypothetical protein